MPKTSSRMLPRLARYAPAVLLTLLVGGCGDGATDPADGVPESALTFLRPSVSAPALVSTVATFWAKRGEDREVKLYYRPRPDRADSTEFLEFEVPAAALATRPDGRAFAVGDSVLISVRVVDPATLKVEFAPAGLRFSPNSPARLEISLAETDDDLDRDGDVDAADGGLQPRLSIWRQEQAGQPWHKQSSVVVQDLDEVEADIFGFTAFAVAY